MTAVVRVVLPHHLRNLAGVDGEVRLDVGAAPATQRAVLDALEDRFPVLRGTIRDHDLRRRPFVRFFGGEQDLSHEPADAPLPDAVTNGDTPFHVVGAMAGG